MALHNLQYMQEETRRLIGRAVFRLNSQGADISRKTIIDTLDLFIEETDDKNKHRVIKATINIFIITNGQFAAD